MTTVYEIADYDRGEVHAVKGDHLRVENGFLHVVDAQERIVTIFARFDSVIAKPAEKE